MATDRNSLIDYIDEYYNTEDNWELLDSTMRKLFGAKILSPNGDDIDDNGPEGIYSNLSNSDLVQLADKLDQLVEGDTFPVDLNLTPSQLLTLKKVLSDYSDITFTKDRQMSKDAAIILQQLLKEYYY